MKKIGIPSNNLVHANALPIVFPIGDIKLAKAYIDSVDALLLAGGQDVSPVYFGEDPHINLHETD
ncbi:MAG: gamma-glutamyl-gamma-aminobutyrate hydrolase family protein, partial [Leuconostoc mesenteroides]